MILDTIKGLNRYHSLHPLFSAAAQFLQKPDLLELPNGKYEIKGSDLYGIVIRGKGKSPNESLLEIHQRYIDLQVVLEGMDSIGWKSRENCIIPDGDYQEEKDVQFFRDKPDAHIPVFPEQFAVYFPSDAHAPMISEGSLHKIVIKVKL